MSDSSLPTAAPDEPVKSGSATSWRKRPVMVEAMQWDGTRQGCRDIRAALDPGTSDPVRLNWYGDGFVMVLEVRTLEGTMKAAKGDWIIKGVAGELYPCKPEIFAATYERAAEVAGQYQVRSGAAASEHPSSPEVESASPQVTLSDEQPAVFAFLLGSGPLDGSWYGDDRKPRYWWRKYLRAALDARGEATPSSPDILELALEALASDEGFPYLSNAEKLRQRITFARTALSRFRGQK